MIEEFPKFYGYEKVGLLPIYIYRYETLSFAEYPSAITPFNYFFNFLGPLLNLSLFFYLSLYHSHGFTEF